MGAGSRAMYATPLICTLPDGMCSTSIRRGEASRAGDQ